MGNNSSVEVEVIIGQKTGQAVLVTSTSTGVDCWVPMIHLRDPEPEELEVKDIVEITLPYWLAFDEGLI